MEDEKLEEELLFELDDEVDEEELPSKRRSEPTRIPVDSEYEAKIALANEKVSKLEEKLSKFDKYFSENDEIEQFRQLETEFSDVDERTKLYQKKLIGKQNEKIAGAIKGLLEELNALKLAVKTEEVGREKLTKEVMQLNDSIILQNVARKALERELPDVVFIDPKTKKKIALGQNQVDQALKLYNTRFVEDATFRKQIEEILQDQELTPIQKQNRIGKNIVRVFNEKIEETLKSKKSSGVSATKKEETSTKKTEEKKEPKSETTSKKELTEEEKKEAQEREKESIRRILNKGL